MNVCEEDLLKAEDLPVIMKQQLQKNKQDFSLKIQPLKASMEKQEKALIEKALQETNGNIKKPQSY